MQNFQDLIQTIEAPEQIKFQQKVFPKIYTPKQYMNFFQLEQIFAKNHAKIIEELNQFGGILFRGFDIKSSNEMASVMNKLGQKPFEYIGGAAVRKLIIGCEIKRNMDSVQIFTTNQAPAHQPIPFHNELLQNENYPEYISFYCLSEADKGGSTPIINCHQLYKYVAEKYPGFLKSLEEKKVCYIRIVGEEDNPNSPIGRGWKNIFKANDKKDAQQKIPKAGYQFKWVGENDCQLISKPLPALCVSKSNKNVFCNQMIAVFKGWIDEKNKPSDCLKFGDFTDIPIQIMKEIIVFADDHKVAIPWKKGDFIILDNEMVAHSREPFTGKSRKIQAMLLKGPRPVANQPHHTLKSGDQMPLFGFGTWKINKQDCSKIIYTAIKSGYRLFDCACDYGNQKQVGEGIFKAISDKLVTRQELFITSKLWNTFHKPQHVKQGFLKTLNDLGLEYLDLYLIHFPIALKYVPIEDRYPPEWIHDTKAQKKCMLEQNVPLIDTWKAMQQLVKEGLVRNIGVCNFTTAILRNLINEATIQPAVLQVQLHPYLSQKKLQRFCREKGVPMTSFSTMGASSYVELSMASEQQLLVNNETLKEIASNKKKSVYQVVLRWAIQQGLAIIPKTTKQQRMKQNRDLIGWSLNENEMRAIDNLNRNKRYNDPGVFCEAGFGTFFPIYE